MDTSYRKEFGRAGENYATKYLENLGYKILARNYNVRYVGELDIVAKIEKTIVFVEVKTRSNFRYGTPAESVTRRKQKRIYNTAEVFLQQKNIIDQPCRFDVIEIFSSNNGFALNHIIDAFSL